MSTVKISALTALTSPATGDKMVIVDVSDTSGASTGTTKHITFSDLEAAMSFVTLTGSETMTNKTLTGMVVDGGYTEEVYALSGTTPALASSNGSIQTWTLTGNSTPTDSLSSGQSITLMIDDGSSYTITWPTITWLDGTAPTLATTGYTIITLFKVGSTLYGRYSGEG